MPLTQQTLRDYFSGNGSFSRKELLIAALALFAIFAGLHQLQERFPEILPLGWMKTINGLLYTIWGAALGKRSRDLGTTFTYGMVIGMIFPVIGVVFLFQSGKKEKEEQAQARAQAKAASLAVENAEEQTSRSGT